MVNLDTAIEISTAASKVDCADDPEDFSAASPNDVIQLIAAARAAGKINDRVIYLLARLSPSGLIDLRRYMSEKAKEPRQPRVDVGRIVEIGLTLSDRDAHEIASIVFQRLGGDVSKNSIRKHLRRAGVIPPAKKKGS